MFNIRLQPLLLVLGLLAYASPLGCGSDDPVDHLPPQDAAADTTVVFPADTGANPDVAEPEDTATVDATEPADAMGVDVAEPADAASGDAVEPPDAAAVDTAEPPDAAVADTSVAADTTGKPDAILVGDAVVVGDVAVISDTAGPTDTVDPPAEPRPGWRLTFRDEFNGPETPGDPCYDAGQTPPMCYDRYWSRAACPAATHAALADLNKCTWSVYDIYNWMDWGKPWGTGINKLDAAEVRVAGGELILNARKVAGSGWDCGNEQADYYVSEHCPIRSGAVSSQGWPQSAGFQQRYGRFEVRARLPGGPGAWPAHWMLPQSGGWPEAGEIDIMEAIWERPNAVHGSFHGGRFDGSVRSHHSVHHWHDTGDPRFSQRYHVYAVEWGPDELRFFVDDLMIGRVTSSHTLETTVIGSPGDAQNGQSQGQLPVLIPDTPFFFILNTSIVPTGGLSQNLSNFQAMEHRIDYVRAYERCLEGEPDCVVEGPRSRVLTNEPWMSASKWSPAYRVTHVGDFDGDGRDDLLLQSRGPGHATYLLRGHARGGFHPEVDVNPLYGMTQAHWSAAFRALHVGDFDGDGADDVLLRPLTAGHAAYLLRADGQGGFHPHEVVTTAFGMTGARWSAASQDLFVGRFDGQPGDDLLLVNRGLTGSTWLLRADGQGGFHGAQDVTSAFGMSAVRWSTSLRQLHLGDFDGDGRTDVLLQSGGDSGTTDLLRAGGVDVFLNVADVTATPWMSGGKWSTAYRVSHVGDFDGDGRDDLLLQTRFDEHATYLLRGDGQGGFHPEQVLTTASGMTAAHWSHQFRTLHVGDLDGDGADDVFLQGASAGHAAYKLIADGQGGFQAHTIATDDHVMSWSLWGRDHRRGHVGDFDGDGRADLFLQALDDARDTFLIRP